MSADRLGMTLARSGMGYVGLWDVGGVEIMVDHLRRSGGELRGELVVSAAAAAVGDGKLHRASFNLSSSTARRALAKQLDERSRLKGTVPWNDYLEEFCAAVLEAERTGAPIVSVGRLPSQQAEGYLIDTFVPEGKTTIIFAAGGTGKSYFAVLAAVCVTTGTQMLGWSVRQGKVLYLDWETDAYEVDERIKRVATGLGIAAPEIDYRACAGPIEDMAEQLAAYITDQRIRLVIVDSVGMASGGSRDGGPAEESAIRLFQAFRHLGTTVLAIDHVTGEDAKSDKAIHKPYGSIYKVNLARSVWELKGVIPADGTPDAHMALYHRKVNKGRLNPPVGVLVTHGETSVTFAREAVEDPGLVAGMSHTARILRVLERGSATVADIAEETGIGEASVRMTLNRGRQMMFVKLPDGTWGRISRGDG